MLKAANEFDGKDAKSRRETVGSSVYGAKLADGSMLTDGACVGRDNVVFVLLIKLVDGTLEGASDGVITGFATPSKEMIKVKFPA